MKLTGQKLRLLRGATLTTVITVVTDRTARDLIPSPTDGDYAYIKDLDTVDKYVTSAWSDDGGNSDLLDIVSQGLNESANTEDTTDNQTTGDGTETQVTTIESTLDVTSRLKNNDVAVVGSNEMDFTFNSISYAVTSFNYSESFTEADTTDSSTDANAQDFETTRAKRELTIEMVMRDDKDDIPVDDSQAVVATLFSGGTISGTLRIESLGTPMTIDETQIQTYTGSFQGAVTESLGNITTNEKLPTLVIAGQGKTYYGISEALNKTISIAINSAGNIDYSLKFSGTLTKTSNA